MRSLTAYERSLLELLLTKSFAGSDALKEQMQSVAVSDQLCNC